MSTNKRLHLRVEGRVQGVYFRASTRDKARSLGLSGWVKNCVDGAVEALAEGPPHDLAALEAWCHQGSPASHVDHVQASYSDAQGDLGPFTVRY